MKVDLEQKQVQTISAQVIQQMEILQLNSQELLEHIEATALENPVLEVSNDRQREEEYTRLERQLNWLASSDVQNRHYYTQDAEFDNDPLHNLFAQEENETLYQYVLSQLSELDLPKNLYISFSPWIHPALEHAISANASCSSLSVRTLSTPLQSKLPKIIWNPWPGDNSAALPRNSTAPSSLCPMQAH